ncbi:hypothetical protein, partial [Prevotella lacticifex]|uniref:hypothetical protein n=1 Tax=Prevotella lacticifex TaxID=2854755 RepID=UPI001CC3ED8D
ARKLIPREKGFSHAVYSLAKAQRTLRFLRNNSLCDLCGLARKLYREKKDSRMLFILSQRREER